MQRHDQRNDFDWAKTRQLSVAQILVATFLPSAIGFFGFHFLAPKLVASGVPRLYAWGYIAAVGLFVLGGVTVVLLIREARTLGIPVSTRACFRSLTWRQWLVFGALFFLALLLSAGMTQLHVPLLDWTGFQVPDYMPFFLQPRLDPTTTAPDILVPDIELPGNYGLIALIAVTLLLNILTEELYFRAWMLPKLDRFGSWSWVISGLLFAFYHSFQLWLLPVLLVASLAMAFIVYKSRSIWPTLVGHLIFNLVFSVLGILLLVLGFAA